MRIWCNHTQPLSTVQLKIIWWTVGWLMTEELSHTLTCPRGSCVQWKRVWPMTCGDERPLLTDIVYLWESSVFGLSAGGFVSGLQSGPIHTYPLLKFCYISSSFHIDTAALLLDKHVFKNVSCVDTNGGHKHTVHIHTMHSMCCVSDRGTFSLRVECRKEG